MALGHSCRLLIAARVADKWNFVQRDEKSESYVILAKRVQKWLEQVKGKTVCVTHGVTYVPSCIFMVD